MDERPIGTAMKCRRTTQGAPMAAPTFAPYSEAVRRTSGSFGVRGRASHTRLQREDGQAMVEFILILPIFLIIAFGVIEFGKGLN
jgi:hypothetical protein